MQFHRKLILKIHDYSELHWENSPFEKEKNIFSFVLIIKKKKTLQEYNSMKILLIHVNHVVKQIYIYQDNLMDEVVFQYIDNKF